MNERHRVVVVGIGLVTPIGLDEQTFWTNMLEGHAGINRITAFDPSDYRSQNGAEVDTHLLTQDLKARGLKTMDRAVNMATLATAQALDAAGLAEGDAPEPHPTAVIVGTAGGASLTVEESYVRFCDQGLRGIRPTTVARGMTNAISSHISMRFRLTGPNYTIGAACASGTNAIGVASRMIRHGYADRAICGGADASFAPGIYGAWDRLGVMSRSADPAAASRPFDVARDGFVLGEGAAILLLESLESAQNRNARIRGEIVGYGEASDALHITRPDPQEQARAMVAAIADADIEPADIGFVNAHGTATKANDECESNAIRTVFGNATDNMLVASNKSFFGHLLGASGAMETAATLLGLESGRVPGNLTLNSPDPACDVPLVGKQATFVDSPLAITNSFGFGGDNAVLALRRWS